MKNIRILLADDHISVREGFRAILETEKNFEVIGEVENGIKAIEFIKENHIDIALLDLSMPEMDGIVATKNIKKIFPDVKVVILTMHDSKHYIMEALQAGVDAYILKMSNFEVVRKAINAIISGESFFDAAVTSRIAETPKGGLKIKYVTNRFSRSGITEREEEIIQLIVQGYTSQDIAQELGISKNTVSNHRKSILKKLKLKTTAALVHLAIEEGLIVK